MTRTAKKLIAELEQLPEEEQEARAASYLEDLRRRMGAQEQQAEEKPKLYEPFRVLREANLDLRPDASVTYERDLYGRTADLDE